MSFIDRRLQKHFLPASVCVVALLALGLTPYFVSWLAGGGFACPTQPDMPLYLQLAAQPYYSHTLHLSDPMIPGGATLYPWLQYIPFVCLTRWLGLSIFWIQVLWTSAAAIGTALTLYLFLWLVFRNKWLAAGITICIWADIDLGIDWFAHRFLFVHPIYLVASDFIAHIRGRPPLARPTFPDQWRLTNPALDLPFVFLQLVVTSFAREHSDRRSLALSGAVFALTFYMYFYLWTMIAAGLCLAMVVDRSGRRTYAWTLALGVALGWPQIAHDYLVKGALSAAGLKHFGLMVFAPNFSRSSTYGHLYLLIGEIIIIGWWVTRRELPILVLAWCMICAGVGLSLATFVTGVALHNYHWAWLAVPLMHVVTLAVTLDLIMLWTPKSRAPVWVCALLVCIYLASGIYLIGSINVGNKGDFTLYSEYNRQRLIPGVTPLRSDSVIAGDDDFVGLAAAAERQRPLAGQFIQSNLLLGDVERRNRFVLQQYLSGLNRESFALLLDYHGVSQEQIPIYFQTFDEVSRDPENLIVDLQVRYVVLPVAQSNPVFLSHGWNLIQPGPYWRIWERIEK